MAQIFPPLIPLRAFEAAARHESFSKAAAELCVTHSAISQNIRHLEERMGVELFVRTGNKVTLTEKGKNYQLRISEAFELIAVATDELTQKKQGYSLQISCDPAVAARWLRPRLQKFREAHTSVELHIISEKVISQFSPQGIDIAIHNQWDRSSPNIHIDPLLKLECFPAANPERLTGFDKINLPDDLAAYSLIHDKNTSLWNSWFRQHDLGHTDTSTDQHFHDFSLAIDAAVDGEGIILADHILCEAELNDGRLVALFDHAIDCDEFCIITTRDKMRKPAVVMFRDWLLMQANESAHSLL